ncbi:MAG: hypothetical protein ACYTGQ_09565, partial [Planctomycetota bacterium]
MLKRFIVIAAALAALYPTPQALAEQPVVRWIVRDAPGFRYHFLDKIQTTKLLHATPELGTFNHHGHLAYYQGVLFANWDIHARDENKSGQHGMYRFSTDQGKTWSEAKPVF